MSSSTNNTPPRQSSPARSFRNRVGTMLRRNSALNAMRPASRASLKADAAAQDAAKRPRSSSISDSGVLVDPAPLASPPLHPQVGPSPLAKEANPTPQPSPAPPPAPLAPEAQPTATPTPLLQSAVPEPVHAEEPPKPIPEPVNEPQPVFTPPVQQEPTPAPPVQQETPSIPDTAAPSITSPPQPRTPEWKPVALEQRRADYFSFGDDLRPTKKPSISSLPPREATPEPIPEPTAESSIIETIPTDSPRQPEEQLAPETSAWGDSADVHTLSPKQSNSSLAKETSVTTQEPLVSSPGSIPLGLSRKNSKSSIASSYGQVLISAPGRRVQVSVDPNATYNPENRRGRSRASSVRCVSSPCIHLYTSHSLRTPFLELALTTIMPTHSRTRQVYYLCLPGTSCLRL